MTASIKKEKKILKGVVDDFLMKVDFYEKWGDSLLDEMLKESSFVVGTKIMSRYFFSFVEKMDKIGDMNIILRRIVKIVMEQGCGLDGEYIGKLIEHFGRGYIDFLDFLGKYNLDLVYGREYFYACFSTLLILPLGKIVNMDLFEVIIRLWVLVDNIYDNGGRIEEIERFFLEGIWSDNEKRREFIRGEGVVIDCLRRIEEMDVDKVGLYERFFKLFKFSYGGKKRGKGEKDLMMEGCLKTRKSLDIFAYSMNINVNRYTFYYMSLLIQLIDDLMDIKKDMIESGVSIFGKNKRRNMGIVMAMREGLYIMDRRMIVFFESILLMFVDYNSDFFEEWFVRGLREKSRMIDLDYFNVREVDKLLEGDGMRRALGIYLSYNKV